MFFLFYRSFFLTLPSENDNNLKKQIKMNNQSTMKPYVIGLDLGGTNSVFGIVDSRGDIKATTAIKTQGYQTSEAYVNAAVDALQIIIDQVGGIGNIKAMGIGAPNANYYTGTPLTSHGEKAWCHWPRCSPTASEEYPWQSPTTPTRLPSARWPTEWHEA